MSLTRHIPNILTLGNLVCGCLGILYSQEFPPFVAAYFVWAACIFDFLDGFAARIFNSASPIGKELDSLADMVSFGVLPSMVIFNLLNQHESGVWINYSAFLIAAFSALRLAKFNIDTNQSDHFIGLPTPANALFITGLVFLNPPLDFITSSQMGLVALTILFALLLVAPINLFALKFKNFGWTDNKLRFTFIIISVLLVGVFRAAAIPLIILLYIVLSLIHGVWKKK